MRDNDYIRPVSRRRFITCAGGASLSLPWLESFANNSKSKNEKPAQRLAFFYLPNGITRRGFFLEKVIVRCLVSRVKTMFGGSKVKQFHLAAIRSL